MKVLFILSSSTAGFWLSELTHPYFLLAERGIDVEFASPKGGKAVWYPESDPSTPNSLEPDDLISKGFLSDGGLVSRVETTLALANLDLKGYDAVHVVGGGGAAIDLYPSAEVAEVLEHFFAEGKVVGAICHGVIALANNVDRIRGRRVTGFSLKEDREIEKLFGKDFIPNFPQPVLERAGVKFTNVEPWGVCVVVDRKMVTGQNQQSASEYALTLHHALTGHNPVLIGSSQLAKPELAMRH